MTQMIRSRAVDPDHILQVADRLSRIADEKAAHALKRLIVEACALKQSD
ncbi:hypothetical protein [Novosphingobium sp. PhB165]|nr:hypothetical protein [Novosphingobium sp. PhB165]